MEWPAEDYAIGSFIQARLAEPYLADFIIKPAAEVLDIGCGDGSFTCKIVQKVPHGHVLGIDSSANMVKLASQYTRQYPNLSVREGDVMSMDFKEQFDCITSFWCLQWASDVVLAFKNIYEALKKKGNILILCPTGEPGPYSHAYSAVKKSGKFPELADFKPSKFTRHLGDLPQKLSALPFVNLKCERITTSLVLPSQDIFGQYVNGMAHFHGHFSDPRIKEINAAMVDAWKAYCQAHYQGEYRFEIEIYKIVGIRD